MSRLWRQTDRRMAASVGSLLFVPHVWPWVAFQDDQPALRGIKISYLLRRRSRLADLLTNATWRVIYIGRCQLQWVELLCFPQAPSFTKSHLIKDPSFSLEPCTGVLHHDHSCYVISEAGHGDFGETSRSQTVSPYVWICRTTPGQRREPTGQGRPQTQHRRGMGQLLRTGRAGRLAATLLGSRIVW